MTGAAGSVSAVSPPHRQPGAEPEEEAAWVKDPNGHFHLRQQSGDVSIWSLATKRRPIGKTKKGSARTQYGQKARRSLESMNRFNHLEGDDHDEAQQWEVEPPPGLIVYKKERHDARPKKTSQRKMNKEERVKTVPQASEEEDWMSDRAELRQAPPSETRRSPAGVEG